MATSKSAQRHGRCVEHVRVEGFQQKVCILAGQDRATIIAESLGLRGQK
jgi:hypothetical protein